MKRTAITYDEKMIMKSIKKQSISQVETIQTLIKRDGANTSLNDILIALDIAKKNIKNLKASI